MKLIIKCFAVSLSLSIFSLVAQAEDKSSGCGLGWKVVNRHSLLSSYTRGITNASTSSTSGMTSGTSGCDQHSLVSNDKKDIHYAEANFHALMTEMAQGQGEFLKGFALVMGCASGQTDDFSRAAQKNYRGLFPAQGTNPSELVNTMKATLSNESVCGYTQI